MKSPAGHPAAQERPLALQTALQHHMAGRLGEAEAIYHKLLEDQPEHPDALYLLGEIAGQRMQHERAVDLILRAIKINPHNPVYYINLGRVYRSQGNPDQAVLAYRQALALQPDNAVAHNGIGNVFFDQGRVDEAIASYRAAIALRPEVAEMHCNLGNALKARSSLDEAASSYLNALELKPNDVDLYNKLGNVRLAQGELNDARACYDIALSIDPNVAESHCNRGNVFQEQGELDEAIASYRRALALKPDFPEACNNLGNALMAQGKQEEAVLCFQSALSFKPEYPEAFGNLGNALKAQGRYDDAIACYRQALSLRPESAEAHFNLGVALMEQGKFDAAMASYRTALSYNPAYVEAHCNLGVVLKEQGRLDEAQGCYGAALRIDPDYGDALYNLGVIYGLKEQYALAEEWYRKALAVDPGMVSAHVNLSAILRDSGRFDEARWHRDQAYRKQCLFVTRFPSAVRDVLILFDAGKGNIPVRYLFPARDNNLIEWMIEYAPIEQYGQLPPYDVVFNAIGDPDVTGPTEQAVARFLAACDKPVLNPPGRIPRTARHLLPALIGDVDGIVLPPVWRVEQQGEWFANPDFRFPLLVRPLASHGGEGVVLVESREALATMQPCRTGTVYLNAYYDYRSADGYFRKYRIIFVDRKPYPYHLAISEHWMVHYVTADMLSLPWKREEERRFLENPAAVLGARGMAAIEAIGRRLDLDYGGIDFSLLPDGRLLVFEANATMLVHPEEDIDALKFKNPYIQKIFDAFSDLLNRVTQQQR